MSDAEAKLSPKGFFEETLKTVTGNQLNLIQSCADEDLGWTAGMQHFVELSVEVMVKKSSGKTGSELLKKEHENGKVLPAVISDMKAILTNTPDEDKDEFILYVCCIIRARCCPRFELSGKNATALTNNAWTKYGWKSQAESIFTKQTGGKFGPLKRETLDKYWRSWSSHGIQQSIEYQESKAKSQMEKKIQRLVANRKSTQAWRDRKKEEEKAAEEAENEAQKKRRREEIQRQLGHHDHDPMVAALPHEEDAA